MHLECFFHSAECAFLTRWPRDNVALPKKKGEKRERFSFSEKVVEKQNIMHYLQLNNVNIQAVYQILSTATKLKVKCRNILHAPFFPKFVIKLKKFLCRFG